MSLLEEVDALMEQERWEDALARATGGSEDEADGFELCWNAGWALVKLERHRESLEHFQRARQIDESSWAAPWGLGVALTELGEYGQAELELRASLSLKRTKLNRMSLALVYLATGRAPEAERLHLDSLAERRSADRLRDYAAFLGDTGRTEEEQSILEEAENTPE